MYMDDRDRKIWKDSGLIDWRNATIHVLTHTLHYGMGIFEGVRAYKTPQGTAIFRLKEHTQRLFNSAKIFQMQVPFDQATILEAQCQIVRTNNLESGYIRPLIWIGSEKLGVSAKGNKIHVAIAAWPWDAYLGENVFIVKNGKLYTPDLASCLDDITRDAVVTMARDLDIEIIEKRITRDEMYCFDESPQSASSTTVLSATARAGRSRRKYKACSSKSSQARHRNISIG